MDFHYRFYHTCGHFGVEPTKQNKSIEALQSNPHSKPRTLRISLALDCPFCFNPALVVKGGEGVLVILTSPPSPFPNTWHIIRACAREDVELGEWSLAHVAGGHMAWISEPCGTVDVIGGVEEISRGHVEDGPTTRVSCSWKEKEEENHFEVDSRVYCHRWTLLCYLIDAFVALTNQNPHNEIVESGAELEVPVQ